MRYHIMESDDIRWNLAAEEHLMNTVDVTEPLLLLYIQKPCVIIGRNQNAYEEIDFQYLRDHDVTLTRRISGGGAVYDDLGNMSFSFVTKKDDTTFGDYRGVTTPILHALQAMGATHATVGGRNDLYIDEMKFSGNAMYTRHGRTYSHGTLMYDVDLTVLDKILTVSKEKIESKATKSVRKSVTNVKPFLAEAYQSLTTPEFRDALLCQIYEVDSLAAIKEYELALTDADRLAIQKLYEERYANDEWIYGQAPKFAFNRRTRIPGVGIVDIHLSTEHGRISAIQFFGDYFGTKDTSELEQLLNGKIFERAALAEELSAIDVSEFILNFTSEELLNLLFS